MITVNRISILFFFLLLFFFFFLINRGPRESTGQIPVKTRSSSLNALYCIFPTHAQKCPRILNTAPSEVRHPVFAVTPATAHWPRQRQTALLCHSNGRTSTVSQHRCSVLPTCTSKPRQRPKPELLRTAFRQSSLHRHPTVAPPR